MGLGMRNRTAEVEFLLGPLYSFTGKKAFGDQESKSNDDPKRIKLTPYQLLWRFTVK